MSIAVDAGLLETRIREFEKTPPVKRASLDELLLRLNQAIDIIENNWSRLPDELRTPIKLGVYQLAERKLTIRERLWMYLFLVRFAMERQRLARYFETAVRLERVFYDLFERDHPRYDESLQRAIVSHSAVATGADGRQTKEEWSEWLRSL